MKSRWLVVALLAVNIVLRFAELANRLDGTRQRNGI
jgi:hypothetical protein